jgi:putative tricarboxylic transport membrane protein
VIGYLFNLVRVPLTPLVLALILGPMLEENFQRSLALSRGDYAIFTSSALSITLVGVCALALVFGAVRPSIAALLKTRPGRTLPPDDTLPPLAPAESVPSKETVK